MSAARLAAAVLLALLRLPWWDVRMAWHSWRLAHTPTGPARIQRQAFIVALAAEAFEQERRLAELENRWHRARTEHLWRGKQ